ncbi:MAG: hypothetical protein WC618_05750 [Patescibacteria group bacterium]
MTTRIVNEYGLRGELVKLLVSKGYPESSFNFEWKQGMLGYDLAVIDPRSSELLAIFELKVESAVVISTEKLREKIKKYAALVSKISVPLYIVSAVQGGNLFAIHKLIYQTKESNFPEFLEVENLPDFNTLKNTVLVLKKKEYVNWLKVGSWIFSGLFLILLIFEWWGKIVITYPRLILIGIICGLFLVPYAYKLKILNFFEFERVKKEKE